MFFISIIILIISYSIFKIFLDIHQIKYIRSSQITDEELESINLTQEYVKKSKAFYANIHKNRSEKMFCKEKNNITFADKGKSCTTSSL